MKYIHYKQGYKYQLVKDYSLIIPIKPKAVLRSSEGWLCLTTKGQLLIKKGYAWDGPSGPALDTPTFMRASLIHDACYQLMREGKLESIQYRDAVDKMLPEHCLEDGMSRLRAWYTYKAVCMFGGGAIDPLNIKKVIIAPGR